MQHQSMEIVRNLRRFAINEEDRKTFLSNVHSTMAAARHAVHTNGNKAKEGEGPRAQPRENGLGHSAKFPLQTFFALNAATLG